MSAITHQELTQTYQVVRVLGEGSFGKVFLVRHKQTKIQYAMKKYSKYYILKNGKQKALIRSSRILQSLDHIRIIKFLYYSIGDEEDEIFLIFQACKKGSLQQIKSKIFNMKQISLIKQIIYQLAQGLQYLKSVSVAHRDIKPSNISFASSGDLKIIDFDQAICFKQISCLLNQDQSFAKQFMQETSSMKTYSRRSRVNSFVGTQLYMSPEMRYMTKTDQRGDIWAYGCILFQMVAGRSFMTQHQQDDQISITLQRLSKQLKSSNIIQTQQVNNILDLLQKILQQNPDNRISIDQIMKHNFFCQYIQCKEGRFSQYKRKLTKFLKGNYNLCDPRNIIDALNLDLIGMKQAQQNFLLLSQYPVLKRYEKQPIYKNQTLTQKFAQKITIFLHKVINISMFKVCYIFGGRCYFKQRSILNQNQKSYILYDEIDSIRIVQDQIIIEGNNYQKWNKRGKQQKEFKWRYIFKVEHKRPDAVGDLVRYAHAYLERLNRAKNRAEGKARWRHFFVYFFVRVHYFFILRLFLYYFLDICVQGIFIYLASKFLFDKYHIKYRKYLHQTE